MFHARSISRVASRTLRTFSTQLARPAYRPSAATTTQTLLRPTPASTWGQSAFARAAFSTSRTQAASDLEVAEESEVRDDLVAKLESELSMEREMRDPDLFPEHLKEFLDNSPFKIEDVLGKEELTMTRKFGDETIKISFSIDDLNNVDEDPDQMQEENAMLDELDDPADLADVEGQSGGANSKGAINQGKTRGGNFRVAPEDSVAASDRGNSELVDEEGEEGEEQEPSFRSHLYITVERPGKGALQIEAVAQEGMIVIDNVYYYKDGKLADPRTRADEEASRDLYTGPPFGNLDEDLQLLFEKYLEERGINTQLAMFVPEYIDFKEQKEYLNWLSGVKSFVQ